MHRARRSRSTHGQAAILKHPEHRRVFRKHLCNKLPQPGGACDFREMTHKNRADSLALVFVDYGKRDLGLPGFGNNVAPTADDCRPTVLLDYGDQGDVIYKVDIEEERGFLLGEMPLGAEEAPIEGLSAYAADSGQHGGAIFGSERTNFHAFVAAQRFNNRMARGI